MRCPKCGARNRDDEAFCISCGVEMKAYERDRDITVECLKCGTLNPERAISCSSCHTRIESPYVRCSKCGRRNLRSDRLCKECDEPLPIPEALAEELEKATPPTSMNCPKCGKPMIPGMLLAPTEGWMSTIRWTETDPGFDFFHLAGDVLTAATFFGNNIRLNGFRCPQCKLLVISY